MHSIRRWQRQLTQYCPHLLTQSTRPQPNLSQHWGQRALAELVQQGRVSQEQFASVTAGSLVEILFDAMQQGFCRRNGQPIQLTYRPLPQEAASMSLRIQPDPIWRQAQHTWDAWQQAGLSNWSPNWAPVIWDSEELRRQTSLAIYHNLTTVVNGDRTLRDLAVKLKQPLIPLTLSLIPYLRKGLMGLVEVSDLSCDGSMGGTVRSAHSSVPFATQVRSSSPLVAYIEDSRFDCVAMNQILSRAGYRFINVRDPLQVLPILVEQNPALIFLDLIMPVTNGYEVCAQIRRMSAFQNTPIIIVTSSDGIVDRVRARLVGSSGFISKPIEPEKVLPVLQSYLPLASSA
jgi:CheY-like chemotaxis protein